MHMVLQEPEGLGTVRASCLRSFAVTLVDTARVLSLPHRWPPPFPSDGPFHVGLLSLAQETCPRKGQSPVDQGGTLCRQPPGQTPLSVCGSMTRRAMVKPWPRSWRWSRDMGAV